MSDRGVDGVTSDPGRMGGLPCLDGTRIPAEHISELIDSGDSYDEIRWLFPHLSDAQLRTVELWASA